MQGMDDLDALRSRLLAVVRAQPESVREATRAPGGGWTPAQVLQHLYRVEALLLAGFEADPAGTENRAADRSEGRPGSGRTRTLQQRLGGLVIHLVFRLGLRVRMPTQRVNPEPPLPFPEIEERWAPVARGLRLHLEKARASAPRDPVMRHPVSGPLGPEKAAAFLLDHMRHHEKQLRRILAQAQPAPSLQEDPSPQQRKSPPTA